jgi:hypothetical protein
MNNTTVSHSRDKETMEAKARWFQSLTLTERMDLLCFYTDLVLENNPDINHKKDAQSSRKCVQIVRKP